MKKILQFLKKYSLILSLVVVLGIMGGGYYFYQKSEKEIKDVEKEIKDKYTKVKEYERAGENAPSPELIGRLTKEKEKLEEDFKIMVRSFSTDKPEVPTFETFPSIEFKEYILFSESKLYKKANRMKVSLPSSLGFPKTGLVSPDQIPIFTLQFEIIKDLINLIINSGITSINSITPGIPKQVSFYKVIPIKLTLTGTSTEIMRCLKYFDNPSSYFVVESFSISKSQENIFRIDIDLNAILLLPEKTQMAGQNEQQKKTG